MTTHTFDINDGMGSRVAITDSELKSFIHEFWTHHHVGVGLFDSVMMHVRMSKSRLEECQRLAAMVAKLSEPQVGWVRCPDCDCEFDVSLSRGRTNAPVEVSDEHQ